MRGVAGHLGASVVLALAVCGTARADLVYLTDGTVVEGEVTYVGNNVRVRRTSGITVTYPRYRVRKVEKSVSAAGEYRKRAESVEPDDAEGLLELARWCVEKKLDTEAEAAYRAVLEVASPVYRRAKREFASLLRGKKRLKEAYALFSELGEEGSHDAAAVGIQLARLRAGAYENGMRRLLSRDYRKALMEFELALKLTPAGARGSTELATRPSSSKSEVRQGAQQVRPDAVTETDVLARIAEARAALAESTAYPVIEMRPCPVCSGTGLVACRTCGGKGTVRRLANVLTKSGMDMQYRDYRCDTCKGGGKVRCTSCRGASIDVSGLGPVKTSVKSLAQAAVSSIRRSPAKAAKRVNQAVLKRRMSFGPGEAPYPEGRELRDLLPGVPASPEEFGALTAAWGGADARERLNFLVNYALESAKLLSHFSKSAYRVPVEAGVLGLDEAKLADAARLSAFPQDAAGRACRIQCVWRGSGEPGLQSGTGGAGRKLPGEGGYRIEFDVDTGSPHTLGVFAWKKEARPVAERLGRVLKLPGLQARAAAYPFEEISSSVQARRPGDRVELVGRFLYDREPSLRWGFEVWKIVPRLDEDTERMVGLLSRKVSFRFESTPLAAALEMLSDLTGARIRLGVRGDVGFEVTARARELPLGHALDLILRPLKLSWALGTIDVKSVRVVERLTAPERARVKELIGLIPRPD